MNKTIYGAMLLSALTLASCSDEITKEIYPALTQGDEVVFTMKPNIESRTMYSDDWGGMTSSEWTSQDKQSIYWGNYVSSQEDNIMIFCQQGARQVAKYHVDPQADNNSTASGITKVEAAGIQWGKEGVDHQFYAFYPAQYYTENSFTAADDGSVKIRARVDQGQSPVAYKAIVNGNTSSPLEGLAAINANTNADVQHVTTIYGQPDMQSAIMMAATKVSGTPDEANQTGYGYPVGLDFKCLPMCSTLQSTAPLPLTSSAATLQLKILTEKPKKQFRFRMCRLCSRTTQ